MTPPLPKLFQRKTPLDLLHDLELAFAAMEAAYKNDKVPRSLKMKAKIWIKRNNWRRKLYLQFYHHLQPRTLHRWVEKIEHELLDLEDENVHEIKDEDIVVACNASLERVSNLIGKLGDRVPEQRRIKRAVFQGDS